MCVCASSPKNFYGKCEIIVYQIWSELLYKFSLFPKRRWRFASVIFQLHFCAHKYDNYHTHFINNILIICNFQLLVMQTKTVDEQTNKKITIDFFSISFNSFSCLSFDELISKRNWKWTESFFSLSSFDSIQLQV